MDHELLVFDLVTLQDLKTDPLRLSGPLSQTVQDIAPDRFPYDIPVGDVDGDPVFSPALKDRQDIFKDIFQNPEREVGLRSNP